MKAVGRSVAARSCLLAVLMAANAVLAIDIDDVVVTEWTGSGANRALMVVDWQEATTIVFGYRWDGAATGLDMMNAVYNAHVGFFREWQPDYVNASVFGMGWDVDGDGGSFVPGTPGDETGYATDPDDYYAEGWFNNGYWAYYVSPDGESWNYSGLGLAHPLADGGWDGWSWSPAPTWDGGVPDNIRLVPEPATLLMGITAVSLGLFRRKRRRT